MPAPYRGVLLDLFGTLITFEPGRLPEMQVGSERVRTTVAGLAASLATWAPGTTPEGFLQALVAVSDEMARGRTSDHVELPSRERFRSPSFALPPRSRAAPRLKAPSFDLIDIPARGLFAWFGSSKRSLIVQRPERWGAPLFRDLLGVYARERVITIACRVRPAHPARPGPTALPRRTPA